MALSSSIDGHERVRLRKSIQCPHCWTEFSPKEILWIAESSELRGDIRLRDEPLRFLPTRFSPEGHALDARGMKCDLLACPNCHLAIPRSLLEFQPFPISIFGGPSSGKSFFLGAMTWELRRIFPADFHLSFNDADTSSNVILHFYEESIFHSHESERPVPLGEMIPKTTEFGDYYDRVTFGDHEDVFSRPFTFALRPTRDHRSAKHSDKISRTICFYDSAGEHFEAGRDAVSISITRPMSQSQALFFTFDPTQDSNFRRHCRSSYQTNPLEKSPSRNQTSILQEAASRIRRYTGLRHSKKYDRPLIVVLTKYDSWAHLLDLTDRSEPWETGNSGASLNEGRILEMSNAAQSMLNHLCPQIVATAEEFSDEVLYIPVSSVGFGCKLSDAEKYAIYSEEIKPFWVTVPLLYTLYRRGQGLVSSNKAVRDMKS